MIEGLKYGEAFPSGGGPWVSVLVPTRGRSEKLLRAWRSLHGNARHPDKVEYLFRVDDDDDTTLRFFFETVDLPPHTLVVGPRSRGYMDLHVGLNKMASLSKGDWLFCFNDDAVMLTKNWDRIFSGRLVREGEIPCKGWFGCGDGIFMLVPRTVERPDSPEFFAVHKRVFEILGHLAPNMGIDDWLQYVLGLVGRIARCAIDISHEDEEDRTFEEGRKKQSEETIHELTGSFRVLRDRLSDVVKLVDCIEGAGE